MTQVTFQKGLPMKRTTFQDVGDFLDEFLRTYEELEDKALWKIAKESDKGDYASMDIFHKTLSI